ncbi:hypothetical protein IEQ34_008768 [Dendrobium chrysotoxum]|uniref:Mediator complex subunit 15 KIX domain-containing protein n=1 Tax=Dendrobium chrysotoxum TaxID=161865 RepID=A0AAV7GZY7_DENCH|nr:hypothetical protein IEQ34_008768 [Dendrobium chrysotoxum]
MSLPPSTSLPPTGAPNSHPERDKGSMDTLRRHLPVATPEGMTELKKIAVRFEEKIYAAAVNQSDYVRKITLKMISMKTKTQHNTPMSLNLACGGRGWQLAWRCDLRRDRQTKERDRFPERRDEDHLNQVKSSAFIEGGRFVLDYLEHAGVLTPEMVSDPHMPQQRRLKKWPGKVNSLRLEQILQPDNIFLRYCYGLQCHLNNGRFHLFCYGRAFHRHHSQEILEKVKVLLSRPLIYNDN